MTDALAYANLAVSVVLLVVVLAPHILRLAWGRRGSHKDTATPGPVPQEALPRGCQWPEKADEFDGVMERFVCRLHGESHLRRRA